MAMFMKGSVCDSKFDPKKGKQISYSYTRRAVKPEILEQNQKTIKRCISKVGGDVKITVKFLKEEWTAADTGINRGAIEIPRRVIRADILKEFDKRKY